MGGKAQEEALVAAVSEALDGAEPLEQDFALVVGSVDRRLVRPLGRARVVMNLGFTGLSLPRMPLASTLLLLGPFVPSMSIDSLVAMRNALARDAAFLVVGPPDTRRGDRGARSAVGFFTPEHALALRRLRGARAGSSVENVHSNQHSGD